MLAKDSLRKCILETLTSPPYYMDIMCNILFVRILLIVFQKKKQSQMRSNLSTGSTLQNYTPTIKLTYVHSI